jgi:hypothetical protein
MSAYHAARAAEILHRESLPDGLAVEEIAILQIHDEQLPELRLSEDQLPLAGVFRELQRATVAATWRRAMQRAIDAGELREDDGKITATEFKRWLEKQGDPPSMLIQGWFALHTRDRKSPGDKWTDDELAELREIRDKHGTKAAAQRFGITTARVRQLLPAQKPRREPARPKLETIWNAAVRQRKA